MEYSTELAALIAGSSITLAGILMAVLSLVQISYSAFDSSRDTVSQAPSDAERGRRLFRIARRLTALSRFLNLTKVIATAFMASFVMALIWLLLIEGGSCYSILNWYSRVTLGVFIIPSLLTLYAIMRIPIERRPE